MKRSSLSRSSVQSVPTALLLLHHSQHGLALVQSAKDKGGMTWGPPQGPQGDISVDAVARLVAMQECGIDHIYAVTELHTYTAPPSEKWPKSYKAVFCKTDMLSLRAQHSSVSGVCWAYSRAALEAIMEGASERKKQIVFDAIRRSGIWSDQLTALAADRYAACA